MTPAERALLLAVAKELAMNHNSFSNRAICLQNAISAVEAEAADIAFDFYADDEAELAEVAAKARACEPEPVKSCATCFHNEDQGSSIACNSDGFEECWGPERVHWQSKPTEAEDASPTIETMRGVMKDRWSPKPTVCPTCNGLGFGLPSEPKQDTTCPTCNGIGKKENTNDHP